MTLRILHSYKIYRPDADGGIPSVIATLGRLVENGIQTRILVARSRGKLVRYQVDSVPVDAVTSFGTIFSTPVAPSFPLALLNAARSNDIVVHHSPFPLADLALHRLPRSTGLIVYWHAKILGFPFLKKLVEPAIVRTLQRADRIVVADHSIIEGSAELSPFKAKISIVPYGVDVEDWAKCSKEEEKRSKAVRAQYPRMILAIGRLVHYKGFDVLLHALREIDGQLVLIGEGPLGHELQRLAKELGLSDRVFFLGRLDKSDLRVYLRAARVLAFPSVSVAEAFGLVQVEAMAAGLPIVNTSLKSAVPEVARHNIEALTVPPNDPRALAAAINQILDDPALAARLGKAGTNRAFSEYSQDKYLSKIMAIYNEVADGIRSKT